MKILSYLFNLPWWTGLPIMLGGGFLFDYALWGYLTGLSVFLFGVWTFSKLLKFDEKPESTPAIIGLPSILLIAWFMKEPYVNGILDCIGCSLQYVELYVIRTAILFSISLYSIRAFTK
jgi:hypothetical protein